MADAKPGMGELWQQARGDRDKYRELLFKHGYLIDCECPCHSTGRGHCEKCKPRLPCGWELREQQ